MSCWLGHGETDNGDNNSAGDFEILMVELVILIS
jgi:hypothetical protein